MIVVIEGQNFPGRRSTCGPTPEAFGNVHVGLGIHQEPVSLVPGDSPTARWQIEVGVVRLEDGGLDYRGRFVHGPRGDRFLYLNWGNVADDGTFALFRRAKLSLSDLDPALVERALHAHAQLVGTVNLTDSKGNPRCARVTSPDLLWQVVEDGPGIVEAERRSQSS